MTPTLIVPTSIDALVVNNAVHARDTFRTWACNYTAMRYHFSPEPMQGSGQIDSDWRSACGVHLHWTLPRGLRTGISGPASGAVTYPLLPNRWLLTRFSGDETRTARAWLIESDCPHSDKARDNGHDAERSSPYLVGDTTKAAWRASSDPYRSSADPSDVAPHAHAVRLGLAFTLEKDGSWTERAADIPLFLDALGAGNPHFTAYAFHHNNVFAFYDDLAGVPDTDTLGYSVIGWYSDPGADVLARLPSGLTYAGLLARLGWSADTTTRATRSVYAGTSLTIPWSRRGDAPTPDPLEQTRANAALDVAVGATPEDAFCALAGRALETDGSPPSPVSAAEMQLLRAFTHQLLPVADEPGGDARASRRIHRATFAASGGGDRWTITPPPGTKGTFTPPAWLAQLNRDQHALDAALGTLHSLQWRLNALWHKAGLYDNLIVPPDGAPAPDEMRRQMKPSVTDSLAAKVADATTRVAQLTAKVPQPEPGIANAHDALLAGISAFARAKGLPEGATLKAVPRQAHWQSVNPTLTVSGVRPPPDAVASDAPLPVRLVTDPSQPSTSPLISKVTVAGTGITADQVMPGMPWLTSLPAVVRDLAGPLLREYFLLDPGSARALSKATGVDAESIRSTIAAHRPADYTGTLPALGLAPWSQPWQPQFIEWSAAYHHLPHADASGTPYWAFDGTDHHIDPARSLPDTPAAPVSGITALGPHTRSLFAARLRDFVTSHGTEKQRQQLDDWLNAVGGWGVLTQELTGFNDQLAAREPRAFRRPTKDDDPADVAKLAGYPDGGSRLPARYLGAVSSIPYLPGGSSAVFHETRQGQVYFDEVTLYDTFGRRLLLIGSDPKHSGLHDFRTFPLVIDSPLRAAPALVPRVKALVTLPPRLLQPARLDIDLLDGRTAKEVTGAETSATPIAGWLLPDHLDHRLLLFSPAGVLLGSYGLTATTSETGQWQKPPGGRITSLDDVARHAPLLAGLLRSTNLAAPQNFLAFLDVIDATLWTTDPLGHRADQNLSVLLGRPLALVPAALRLSLSGPPLPDSGWAATLEPPSPKFTAHRYPVRLGDQAARDDGLIGYFTVKSEGETVVFDHEAFYSVAAPDNASGQTFSTRIGPPGAVPGTYPRLAFDPQQAPTKLLLLVDPRAPVHATTGILPTAEAALPAGCVDEAFAHLEAGFRFGPVLAGEDPRAIAFPTPHGKQGSWSWARPDTTSAGWTTRDLAPLPPDAQFPDTPPALQEGLLRLTVHLA